MSEVVRHFPLTQEQENSLRELRESVKLESAFTQANLINRFIYEASHKNREKLIGQNTLRFIVQHVVYNETGLKHWFDFNQYMALDKFLSSARLLKRA